MFGSIVCEFYFGKEKVIHKVFILPDEESVVPLRSEKILIFNRNMLSKMNLNNNKPDRQLISALMFF